jgi:hypothetical protein
MSDSTAVTAKEDVVYQTKDTAPSTELVTSGEVLGSIELAIPDLAPTDNVASERTLDVERIKIPTRISNLSVREVGNGFIVVLPGGARTIFGPAGSQHIFGTKEEMLTFVGSVIGQVTYMTEEREVWGEDDEEGSGGYGY